MYSQVVPAILQVNSAEEKNTVFYDRTYDVLAVRFGVRASSRAQRKIQSKLKQHNQALKKVTELENSARRDFRKAKREGENSATVQALAGKFLSLLRTHSRFKKASSHNFHHNEAKLVRKECHQNFWSFAKGLFDGHDALHSLLPE